MSATIARSRAGLEACPRERASPDAKRATRREVNVSRSLLPYTYLRLRLTFEQRYNTAAEGRLTHSKVSPDST